MCVSGRRANVRTAAQGQAVINTLTAKLSDVSLSKFSRKAIEKQIEVYKIRYELAKALK